MLREWILESTYPRPRGRLGDDCRQMCLHVLNTNDPGRRLRPRLRQRCSSKSHAIIQNFTFARLPSIAPSALSMSDTGCMSIGSLQLRDVSWGIGRERDILFRAARTIASVHAKHKATRKTDVCNDMNCQDMNPAVMRVANAIKHLVSAGTVACRALVARKARGWYLGRTCIC
jgi:hypothetical protein